jgi:hypothetical protein
VFHASGSRRVFPAASEPPAPGEIMRMTIRDVSTIIFMHKNPKGKNGQFKPENKIKT